MQAMPIVAQRASRGTRQFVNDVLIYCRERVRCLAARRLDRRSPVRLERRFPARPDSVLALRAATVNDSHGPPRQAARGILDNSGERDAGLGWPVLPACAAHASRLSSRVSSMS
jgi:hypothetical protein